MNKALFILLIFSSSCIPNMHEGPEPHSIAFDEVSFNQINTFLKATDISYLDFENKEHILPRFITNKINNNRFLTYYYVENKCQIYICGFGVLDQPQWGFVFGELSFNDKELPSTIADHNYKIEFTNLKPLKSNWYRFSGHITETLGSGNKTNNY